jgi:hypothetical protein
MLLRCESLEPPMSQLGQERRIGPVRNISALPVGTDVEADILELSLRADFVAKRFCASEGARLIQDQARMRNLDSRIHSPRFDCCVFLFHRFTAVTFATKSATSGLMHCNKQGGQVAMIYSITSSASESRLSEILMPSALAVLRLITRSYFVGACTGRFAGFSPLRMRST